MITHTGKTLRLRGVAIVTALLCLHPRAQASADTLRLSLPAAEQQFLDNNLSLLASRYAIDANKALAEQAALWDNPVLVTDQNIYANGRFFEHGRDANGQPTGQYFIQLQQLIKTAGKRSKYAAMANTNTKISELQFADVMRTLRYQLRTDYFTIARLAAVHDLYRTELAEVNTLLTGMLEQLKAGNIAQKDYLRLQALELGMRQDLLENDKQLADAESDLATLLQLKGDTYIDPVTSAAAVTEMPSLPAVLDSARQYNPTYAIERAQLQYQQQNLVYQQALRAPDLTVGPEYDHNSNYAPHYVGLSISLPLNVFNRNQGNIKSARFTIKQQEATVDQAEQQLTSSIRNALNKLNLTATVSGTEQNAFYSSYGKMFRNITESYKARQIGLFEFIDYFDAYRDTHLKYLTQQLNLQLAKEEVNFLAGKDVIH